MPISDRRLAIAALAFAIFVGYAEDVSTAGRLGPTQEAHRWRQLLPGIVRGEAGTIEITACFDRPMAEFGNDWEFLLQIVPGTRIGRGAHTLVGIFVPPAPATGLVGLLRNGTQTYRIDLPAFTCVPGKPVNLAISWGSRLTLWQDGVELASTVMDAPPAEKLWPAVMELGRKSPFNPCGIRISSIERTVGTLDAQPQDGFLIDPDTTLIAGSRLSEVVTPISRWQQESGYALVKPLWRPEAQCLRAGDRVTFPLAMVNHAAIARTAHLELVLTPLSGASPITVTHEVVLPERSPVHELALALPVLPSDWYQVAWKIGGPGLPVLAGNSAIAVYPHDDIPTAGALSAFYGVHRPETWSTLPFTRMGVSSTRAWAHSAVFLWNRVEPTPGLFRWEECDAYVQSCLEGGLEIVAVLGYPSRWASVEPSAEHRQRHELAHRPARWKPADLQAWTRYVRAVAERYQGRVRHWEIYNEVNFCPPGPPATFSGSTSDYLALQRIAYEEIKRSDPGALILSSGFSADVNQAMPMEALTGGLAQWCDIFNVHGYSGVEGTAELVAEWRKRRPGAPVWMTEQMWFQIEDDRRRWWLTAALPVQYAADGYARFMTMGIHEVYFDRSSASPTRDQWVTAVMANELRPCSAFAGRAAGAGALALDLSHRFRRSDGSWLTVVGSERGPMTVALSAVPQRARDLFGRPLRTTQADSSIRLEIPDLAWLVSDRAIEILSAEPLGDAPLTVNAGFEQIDGDVAMGGLTAGRPRGYTLRDKAYDPEGAIHLSRRPRSGSYAVELSSTGAGRVYLFQKSQIPGPGHYQLSGWFRRESGNPEPYIFVFDQDREQIHEAKLAAIDREFSVLRLQVELPERNRKPLAIGWGIRGSGTVTLDDTTFTPWSPPFDHRRFRAVDLEPVANLELGNWRRIWPAIRDADLSALTVGEQVLAGRSFKVGGGQRSLIVVGGEQTRRVEIPAAGVAAGLSFLHTALWVKAAAGQELGRYLITYDDGSTIVHPIINQRGIADWYSPIADPSQAVAMSVIPADRIPRNVYSDRWSNPHPTKALRSITIDSTSDAALIVVAISREELP